MYTRFLFYLLFLASNCFALNEGGPGPVMSGSGNVNTGDVSPLQGGPGPALPPNNAGGPGPALPPNNAGKFEELCLCVDNVSWFDCIYVMLNVDQEYFVEDSSLGPAIHPTNPNE
ncbi:unnamed protein product [Anisakis simplex]|uniref:Secreted protein n=1 Tax=Anisakis simplex TaxID=6269 RepID=A0A0M3JZR7_ANISI|nr:unnamed protein product [Anisakis simplex]